MFGWFTAKSVERTDEVLRDPFSVYDLTFLEWEQKEVLRQNHRVYICTERTKKNKTNKTFEVIYKKDRLSIYSIYRKESHKDVELMYKTVEQMLNSISEGITSNKPLVIAPTLRDIVNSIRTHPQWTSAHIAAKAGLDLLFTKKTDHVLRNLNAQSLPDLSTPLHLAIESGRVGTTKAVLALRPKLNLRDEFGNSAIHLAAMSDKEILQELLKEQNIMEMLKWKNKRNCTPIHLSCYAFKYENVIRFMEFGLTVQMLTVSKPTSKKPVKINDKIVHFKSEDIEDLDTEDIQYGGTPLHWVKHRRALERFITYGFELDSLNALGETALHTLVKRMRLKCMIGLLCFGAKVNRRNDLRETPLHLAVKAADVTSSQALIIFDAKINYKNKNKESVRHIAAQLEHPDHHMVLYLLSAIGAERCPKEMTKCRIGCAYNGDYEGKPYYRWPKYDNELFYKKVLLEHIIKEAVKRRKDRPFDKPEGVRMLCLDGGGIRGLISIQVLIELQQRLGKNKSIADCFEWYSGTSTGSILAFLMATKRPLKEIRGIYFRFKDKILVGSRPYSSKNFETLLEEEFKAETRMCDVLNVHNRHLIINAVLIDRNPATLHLFRSYESPEEILGLPETPEGFKAYPNHKEQIAWKACRASGAAPTYFRASGAFLDGGLIANNPTLDALTEFKLYNNAMKAVGRTHESEELALILSLGTGKFPATQAEPIDVVKMWSFNPREIHKNTLYLRQMGNLLINQVCATEGYVIDRAQAWCSGIKTPYFRLNPLLSEVISLDETSDVEICNAMWETKAYMFAMKQQINDLIVLLSSNDPNMTTTSQHNTSPETSINVDLTKDNIQIISKTQNNIEDSDQNKTIIPTKI